MVIYGKRRTRTVEITHRILDVIEDRLVILPGSDCHHWTKARTPDGYGVIRVADHIVYVHRIIHTVYTAPIPQGYVVDHTCLNRACANPDHLEAVLWAENSRLVWARRRAGVEGY